MTKPFQVFAVPAGYAGSYAEVYPHGIPHDAKNVRVSFIDVATGQFSHVHGYPVSLSRDGRFALVFGGRPTGGPGGGRLPPEKISALPFGHRGLPRLLARGDVCCPSWNR